MPAHWSRAAALSFLWLMAASSVPPLRGQPGTEAGGKSAAPDPAAALQRAIQGVAAEPTYLLRYNLPAGSTLQWECEQSASTKTRMASQCENVAVRSRWQCRWEVAQPDGAGNFRLSTTIAWFTLWQQVDDRNPVTFDSRLSDDVPDEYVTIADRVVPSPAAYVVSPAGRIIRQDQTQGKKPAGLTDIVIPLPEEPVPAGTRWYVPREITVRDEGGAVLRVALRTAWELTRVVDGKAFISFRTELLTPGLGPSAKSQLLQNLPRGHVIFDLRGGFPIYRETEWNERVQSFASADSYLEYVARVSERYTGSSIAGPGAAVTASPLPAGSSTMTSMPAGDEAGGGSSIQPAADGAAPGAGGPGNQAGGEGG